MGIDVKVKLPSNVSFRNVSKAIAIILGAKPRLAPLGNGGKVTDVPDGVITLNDNSVTSCQSFNVNVPDRPNRWFLYHYEYGNAGHRGLSFNARNPSNIDLAKAIVDFFGGDVDFDDCDDVECDYSVPAKSDLENHPEDNEEWDDLQHRLMAIKPIEWSM